MRRRVVCPRSHPASPFAPGLSVRFAMARGIFRGDTPGPPCRPTLAAAPPLVTHSRARCALRRPRAWLAAPRVGGRLRVALPAAVPPSPTVWGASSRGAAGGAEGVFAGRCGLGAASSLRMRLWRRIFASEPVVAPHLRFPPCRGGQPRLRTAPRLPVSGHARPWRRPRCRCDRGAASASRSPVVHFAHTRDAPSTARGDFRRRSYRPWPRKLSRRTCMCTVPGRDVSPRRNPRLAHIP